MQQTVEIVIVASHHREPLIVPHLVAVGAKFSVSLTPDYPMPTMPMPLSFDYLNNNSLGAYRCFKGHQEAVKSTTADRILVLEDDAAPATSDWWDRVQRSVDILGTSRILEREIDDEGTRKIVNETITVASLYGHFGNVFHPVAVDVVNELHFQRLHNRSSVRVRNGTFVGTWAMGGLAYLLSRAGADKFSSAVYDGLPVDLYIHNRLGPSAVLSPSPFRHDNGQKSVLENAA